MSVYKQAFNKLFSFSMAEHRNLLIKTLSSVNARGRNKVVLIGIKLNENLYENFTFSVSEKIRLFDRFRRVSKMRKVIKIKIK